MRLHIVDGAITELRRTVSLQPNNRAARIDLAGLCIDVGLLSEASQEAKTVLTANPQDADAHALLADVAYASGNRETSIAELRQAISIAEDHAAFHASLGTIFWTILRIAKRQKQKSGEPSRWTERTRRLTLHIAFS